MDRFLMHVNIEYPPVEDEVLIVDLVRGEEKRSNEDAGSTNTPDSDRIPQDAVFSARTEIANIHVSDAMKRYVADLVYATRTPDKYSEDLDRWIDVGGSPRASLALDKCSRTHAWLNERDFVDPEDVHAIVHDCLRHRLDAVVRGARRRRLGRQVSSMSSWSRSHYPDDVRRPAHPCLAGPLAEPAGTGARLEFPAQSAVCQRTERPARVATAGPWPQLRGDARLPPGRRHPLDRLEGDSAHGLTARAGIHRRTRPAPRPAGRRPAHVDVLRVGAQPEVGHGCRSGRDRCVSNTRCRRSRVGGIVFDDDRRHRVCPQAQPPHPLCIARDDCRA